MGAVVSVGLFTSSLVACSKLDASVAPVSPSGIEAGADAAERPEPSCPAERPDSGTCVHYVEGAVADVTGKPIGPASVTVCGPGTCYGGRGDGAGQFKVRVGGYIDLATYRVHLDGRPDYADRFASLDGLTGPVLRLQDPIRTVKLPASGPPLVSGGSATTVQSGTVTVRVQAGTEFDFGFANLSDEIHGKELRTTALSPASIPEWSEFSALVAFGPFGSTASKPLGIRLDLSVALVPLAPVEILVLQDDYASPDLGRMVVQAAGHVSADGLHVDTDDGQGVQRLTWIGVRELGKGK